MIDDPQIKAASELLVQRMKEFMALHTIPTCRALSKHTGLPNGSVAGYLYRGRLPESDRLKQLRGKITTITDEDVKILETASSRNISLSRSSAGAQPRNKKPGSSAKRQEPGRKPEVNSQPHPTQASPGRDVLREVRIGQLAIELFGALMPAGSAKASAADQVASLLAQDKSSPYTIGDMPAVLTKDNFREIDVSGWSEAEKKQLADYTNQMLEQARKCLMLLAQFTPGTIREELLKRIRVNTGLLWRTYKVAVMVVPQQFIQDIDLSRVCEQSNLPQPQAKGV